MTMNHISKNILKSNADLINVNLMRGKTEHVIHNSNDKEKNFNNKGIIRKKDTPYALLRMHY